jgi:hypothetical protein
MILSFFARDLIVAFYFYTLKTIADLNQLSHSAIIVAPDRHGIPCFRRTATHPPPRGTQRRLEIFMPIEMSLVPPLFTSGG